MKNLEIKPRQLIEVADTELKMLVAQLACEQTQCSVADWLANLVGRGCIAGVDGLRTYAETHEIFDAYYPEIEAIRQQLEDETGEQLPILGDLKNWLAWFGVEEVARQMLVTIVNKRKESVK